MTKDEPNFVINVLDEMDMESGTPMIESTRRPKFFVNVPLFPSRKQPSFVLKKAAQSVAPVTSAQKKNTLNNKLEDSLSVSTRVSALGSQSNGQQQQPRQNYIVNNYLQTVRKNLNSPNRVDVEGQIIKNLIQQNGKLLYMIHMEWTSAYTDFLQHKCNIPPNPIDNTALLADRLLENQTYKTNLKQDQDFVLLNLNTWSFIVALYGGGPEVKYNDYLKEVHGLDDIKSDVESQFPNISLTLSRLSSLPSQKQISIEFNNGSFELNPIGFQNEGNFCFMHAGIQGLLTIEQLNCWVLTEGRALVQNNEKKYPWLYSYFELVLAVQSKVFGSTIKVQGLKEMIKEVFPPKEQHDAQEFLRFFLDQLHTELKKDDQFYQPITDILFQGQMLSELTCQNCLNVSSRFENFLDLSVSMHRMHTIHDSLQDFFAQESINDNYHCDCCLKRTTAVKRFVIGSSPTILMIHIKRFIVYPVRAKLYGHLEFPSELSIEKYCSKGQESKYILKSVVVHFGTPERGHYVCFAQRQNAWFYFDDQKIYQVHEKDVLKQQAYLLFYQMKDEIFFQ